jgi:hypothetical protein
MLLLAFSIHAAIKTIAAGSLVRLEVADGTCRPLLAGHHMHTISIRTLSTASGEL